MSLPHNMSISKVQIIKIFGIFVHTQHFSGYLWLNRPHKKQKWKRVFTCLYSSPALTYLVWWANKHENQIRGFLLLNDYDVVHYLANSICIKPVSTTPHIKLVTFVPIIFLLEYIFSSPLLMNYVMQLHIRYCAPLQFAIIVRFRYSPNSGTSKGGSVNPRFQYIIEQRLAKWLELCPPMGPRPVTLM